MTRVLSLLPCLSLALCMTLACDDGGGDGDSNDSTTNSEAAGDGDGDPPQPCGTEWAEKTDPAAESIMGEWGAPCEADADCMPILGEGAVCVKNILEVYDLPGGFCSKNCVLPDTNTTFVHDAVDCDPNGGVTCIGALGFFSACIIPCDSSDQCGREGYGCRTMPTIASEGDPNFCLMNPADCCVEGSPDCAP